MTSQVIPPLIFSSCYIIDGHARNIGLFSDKQEAETIRVYLNLFITAPDLLAWV
jgi:hypothetical protein